MLLKPITEEFSQQYHFYSQIKIFFMVIYFLLTEKDNITEVYSLMSIYYVLLAINMWYWIISYVCFPRFSFPYKSLF